MRPPEVCCEARFGCVEPPRSRGVSPQLNAQTRAPATRPDEGLQHTPRNTPRGHLGGAPAQHTLAGHRRTRSTGPWARFVFARSAACSTRHIEGDAARSPPGGVLTGAWLLAPAVDAFLVGEASADWIRRVTEPRFRGRFRESDGRFRRNLCAREIGGLPRARACAHARERRPDAHRGPVGTVPRFRVIGSWLRAVPGMATHEGRPDIGFGDQSAGLATNSTTSSFIAFVLVTGPSLPLLRR